MDFHALFDAQYADVHRYLAHRLGDEAAAEDLASETFLRAYRARESYVAGSPRAWLFTIATNLLRDHVRSGARRDLAFASLAGHAPPPPSTEFAFPDPELAEALATLREEEREALLLLAWAELSYEEIAAATGVAALAARYGNSEPKSRIR